MVRFGFLLLLVSLSSCSDIPADPEKTSEHIRASGQMTVGLASDDKAAAPFIGKLEQQFRAKAKIKTGEADELLYDLESGEIDVVVGSFAKSTPWNTKVWLSSAIKGSDLPEDEPALRAAARLGENRWIMTLEKLVKQQ